MKKFLTLSFTVAALVAFSNCGSSSTKKDAGTGGGGGIIGGGSGGSGGGTTGGGTGGGNTGGGTGGGTTGGGTGGGTTGGGTGGGAGACQTHVFPATLSGAVLDTSARTLSDGGVYPDGGTGFDQWIGFTALKVSSSRTDYVQVASVQHAHAIPATGTAFDLSNDPNTYVLYFQQVASDGTAAKVYGAAAGSVTFSLATSNGPLGAFAGTGSALEFYEIDDQFNFIADGGCVLVPTDGWTGSWDSGS
jgi:hypothetical protein